MAENNGSRTNKRRLKEIYCYERKTFDRLNRKYKRQFQLSEQQKLEDKINSVNQRDFWKSIGKIGIVSERKHTIPFAVVDDFGNVNNNKLDVLEKWK